jgi:hypothetical protein
VKVSAVGDAREFADHSYSTYHIPVHGVDIYLRIDE